MSATIGIEAGDDVGHVKMTIDFHGEFNESDPTHMAGVAILAAASEIGSLENLRYDEEP